MNPAEAAIDEIELLQSVCLKAWGTRMNGFWSAWANAALTADERAALRRAGIEMDPRARMVSAVTVIPPMGQSEDDEL